MTASDERGGQAAAEHFTVMGQAATEVSAFGVPAGTVTFLLTDIEGSTRLGENAPTAMPEAIARHYEILDEVIARHGGVRPVEQREGDSVVAVFTRARDAVAAALDAQRGVLAEEWPIGAELRVRMALHTGDAVARRGQLPRGRGDPVRSAAGGRSWRSGTAVGRDG